MIGSGSLSFELIRALVNKLPVMVTPQWVRTPTQPIAVEDVIAYLVHGLECEEQGNAVFEIAPGPDQVSYGELMHEYARQIGVRPPHGAGAVPDDPAFQPVAGALVTPLYARIGKKLIDSLRNETVVRSTAALARFPVRPLSVRQAIARALQAEDREMAATRWSDAVSSGGETSGWGGRRFGSRLVDRQQIEVPAPPERAFAPIQRIGGRRGWYFATWLWVVRGLLDLLVGGVGMRRGPPASGGTPGRGPARFLAGGGVGSEPAAPPRSGDESAGTGVAPVRGGAGGGREPDHPDGGLRPAGAERARLLVRALPDPLADLPADAPGGGDAGRPSFIASAARIRPAICLPREPPHEADGRALVDRGPECMFPHRTPVAGSASSAL